MAANAPSPGDHDFASRALGFLAGRPDLLAELIAASGGTPQALRIASQGPDFASFLAEFLLRDDDTLLAFAAAESQPPASVAAALRRHLGRDFG